MMSLGEEAVVAEPLVEQVQQTLLVPAQAPGEFLGVGTRIAHDAENGHTCAQESAIVVAAGRIAAAGGQGLDVHSSLRSPVVPGHALVVVLNLQGHLLAKVLGPGLIAEVVGIGHARQDGPGRICVPGRHQA